MIIKIFFIVPPGLSIRQEGRIVVGAGLQNDYKIVRMAELRKWLGRSAGREDSFGFEIGFADDVFGAVFGFEIGLGEIFANDAEEEKLHTTDKDDNAGEAGPAGNGIAEGESFHDDDDDHDESDETEENAKEGS